MHVAAVEREIAGPEHVLVLFAPFSVAFFRELIVVIANRAENREPHSAEHARDVRQQPPFVVHIVPEGDAVALHAAGVDHILLHVRPRGLGVAAYLAAAAYLRVPEGEDAEVLFRGLPGKGEVILFCGGGEFLVVAVGQIVGAACGDHGLRRNGTLDIRGVAVLLELVFAIAVGHGEIGAVGHDHAGKGFATFIGHLAINSQARCVVLPSAAFSSAIGRKGNLGTVVLAARCNHGGRHNQYVQSFHFHNSSGFAHSSLISYGMRKTLPSLLQKYRQDLVNSSGFPSAQKQ